MVPKQCGAVFLGLLAFVVSLLLFMFFATHAEGAGHEELALVGARVYPSPTAPALDDAVVLVRDGVIVEVAPRGKAHIQKSAKIVNCSGDYITAGFWNSHVHFMEPVWNGANTAPAARLEDHMQQMLTRWGFTSVFDIASNPADTIPLRERVDRGEIPGPKIYTTAGAIYPENGIPVYIPADIAKLLGPFQAATPADAARLARQSIAEGADGIKVFAGAIAAHGKVIPMPVEVIRAAADVAHAAGKPLFAHPSNHVGTDNALAGGVDVLAHTIPMESDWTPEELQRVKTQHVALTPTLSMFGDEERKAGGSKVQQEAVMQHAANQLKTYRSAGGTVLFGTDVGYTQLYDTTSEYDYMARAGMNWRDILASLTTSPAGFFKHDHNGQVTQGYAADLVVLAGDPAADVRNFAKVRYTIRGGKVIYAAK